MWNGGPEEVRRIEEDRDPVDLVVIEDVATILSQLPASGVEDDVSRVMELYEKAERAYRAGVQANAPRVGSSASANG